MYSGDRLVRSVTTVEPEWDDDERAWVLAYLDMKADTCGGCGGYLPDTTAAEADDGYIAEDPIRCHRCDALSVKRAARQNTLRPEALTLWPVHRK